jgi:hypothetical protein
MEGPLNGKRALGRNSARRQAFAAEAQLFSATGGGASATLGYTSRDGKTSSFVALKASSPSLNLKGGLLHHNDRFAFGCTLDAPLMGSVSQDEDSGKSVYRFNGNIWTLFRDKGMAVGASCKIIDGQPDTIDALISYRPQSSKLQDPKTELTLRAVQRLTGGPSSPSFYASYYERMITRRGIQNPLEQPEVQFIANPFDMGMEASVSEEGVTMSVGAAWQLNKNLLVKGKVGNLGLSLVAAAKSWWAPSATAALTVTSPWRGGEDLKFGLLVSIENWGAVDYQRPADTYNRYVPMRVETTDERAEPDTEYARLRRLRV